MNYKYKEFHHNQACTCTIEGTKITDGKISINDYGEVYICQNEIEGGKADDILKYRYSWFLVHKGKDFHEGNDNVTDLKLLKRGRPKKVKPPKYIVLYERYSDPYELFETKEEMFSWLKENKDIRDVRIFELGKEWIFKTEVSLEEK